MLTNRFAICAFSPHMNFLYSWFYVPTFFYSLRMGIVQWFTVSTANWLLSQQQVIFRRAALPFHLLSTWSTCLWSQPVFPISQSLRWRKFRTPILIRLSSRLHSPVLSEDCVQVSLIFFLRHNRLFGSVQQPVPAPRPFVVFRPQEREKCVCCTICVYNCIQSEKS